MSRGLRRPGALLPAFLVLACSLDERELTSMYDGISGGRGAQGGSTSHRGGSSDSAGDTGEGGDPPTSGGKSSSSGGKSSGGAPTGGDGCQDLDKNGVRDCEETLVKNPAFDADADEWKTEADTASDWEEIDASSSSQSGSLVVENSVSGDTEGMTMSGVTQCVEITGGKNYVLLAQAYLQPSKAMGLAGLTAWFFDKDDCSGTQSGVGVSPMNGTISVWNLLRTTPLAAPATAKSMLVRLGVAKPFKAEPFHVRYDNVLVKVDTTSP